MISSLHSPVRIFRLGQALVVVGLAAVGSACTLELDDDRAAARRIAERIERSVERSADDTGRIDVAAVTAAVDIVFGGAILDDIVDAEELAVAGLDDGDGDGRDDDGRFEIAVADATACLSIEADRAWFEVEPC